MRNVGSSGDASVVAEALAGAAVAAIAAAALGAANSPLDVADSRGNGIARRSAMGGVPAPRTRTSSAPSSKPPIDGSERGAAFGEVGNGTVCGAEARPVTKPRPTPASSVSAVVLHLFIANASRMTLIGTASCPLAIARCVQRNTRIGLLAWCTWPSIKPAINRSASVPCERERARLASASVHGWCG
ncbi:MAG: hypothetical protein EXR73_08900 [Myxococcales bacterium]|nr:hypothetical protein [Myxococcales bacterium]